MSDGPNVIELIKMVSESQQEMTWQPIETAPKVGVFLVFLPGERRKFEVMYRAENTSIVGGAFGFDRSAPTHWMPLPHPPHGAA